MIKAGVPCEEPMTQAMMIETRRAPGGRQDAQCPCFLFGAKGGKRRRGVPRHHAKVYLSVQRDQDQQDGRTEITVEPKTVSSLVPLVVEDQL